MLKLIIGIVLTGLFSFTSYANDSDWLNQKIAEAVKSGQKILLEKNRTYTVESRLLKEVRLDQGAILRIDGNGSTIVFITNSKSDNSKSKLFNVVTKDNSNTEFSIENLTIIGKDNAPQFAETRFSNLKLGVPIFTDGVNRVLIKNLKMEDIYGTGMQCLKFSEFYGNNLDFKRVGGKWHKGNEYDSFGDAVYFGWTRNNAKATVENSNFVGYPESPSMGGFNKFNLCRAGIVAEFNTSNLLNLEVKNTSFEGFHRTVHIEESNTALKLDKVVFKRFGCGVFIYGSQAKDVHASNCSFYQNYSNAAFGIALGMFTSYGSKSKAVVENNYMENDVYWRENEMDVTYVNSKFKFDKFSKVNRKSSYQDCTFETKASIPADFGKLDSKTKANSGGVSVGRQILRGVLEAILK